MDFWCRKCQSRVGVRAPDWRVNMVGKPNAGGQCANCGDEVLRRITGLDDAPAGVAHEAKAVEACYQHWRKARKEERDQQIRAVASLFRQDPKLVEKLAEAFRLRPQYVQLIIRDG